MRPPDAAARAALVAALTLAVVLSVVAPAPMACAAGDFQPGAALFAGAGLSARMPGIGGLALEGAAAGCGRCHGDGARGRTDGGIPAPAIRWRVLASPTAARPAYDTEALRRALEDGLDPTGRSLHPFMPRYRLEAQQVAALASYLDNGLEGTHPAVEEAEVRLLVPHLLGEEAIPALLDAMWDDPSRRAWGRRLRAVPLPLRPGDARRGLAMVGPVLAATGGPGRRVADLDAALAAAGLLHLFPIDGYDETRPGVILAEAPLSTQMVILRRRAVEIDGGVVALCGNGIRGEGCVEAVPPDARAVLLGRSLPANGLSGFSALTSVYAALDQSSALLMYPAEQRKFSLVLADPRGRSMPGTVLVELRRLAPTLLAERPEVARRAYAAAALTALALQQAGPRPAPADLRDAAGTLPPAEVGALAAPWKDGTRSDGAYGVQILRLLPGSDAATVDVDWMHP